MAKRARATATKVEAEAAAIQSEDFVMSTIRDRADSSARPIAADVAVSIPVLVYEDESGGYWADVPALPGCVSEGDTLDEVLANVREAAQGCVLARHDVETRDVK